MLVFIVLNFGITCCFKKKKLMSPSDNRLHKMYSIIRGWLEGDFKLQQVNDKWFQNWKKKRITKYVIEIICNKKLYHANYYLNQKKNSQLKKKLDNK